MRSKTDWIMNICKAFSDLFVFLAIFNGFTTAEESYAVNGSTVQLKCPVKSTSQTWIIWSKKVGNIFETYSELTTIDTNLDADLRSRLQVTGDQAAGEYHLNISDVRRSDEGTYKCLLVGTSGGSTQQLTVIVGPTSVYIENVTSENKILGKEGQDMTIKCTAVGGQPLPDIKLVILGSNYTGLGSAQHTFKPYSSDDGSTVKCQAGYNQINFNPFSTFAYIHLLFKPVITPFDPETLSTDESKLFVSSCKSTGSRPAASMYWLLGQQNITSNSTSQSNEESSADRYAVTSNLRYRVDRRYNGRKLICRASNVVGEMETSLTLNVKYAPGVTVENKTFLQTQTSRQLPSTLDSNPPVNICTWQHKSKYGENIRNFSNKNQLTLTLPTVPEDQRYQDTGEYVCTCENGIMGINGQLKQTGSGYLISNAPPVITPDNNSTQYGKFGKSTELQVNVYSIPKFSEIKWFIGNERLVPTKYATNEKPAIVKDKFHNVEVQLDGYRISLTIINLQKADFTNYTLRLMYSRSQYVYHEVTLESASAPETPSNFTITGSGETSITVQWIPGYDGGQTQTFYIEYCVNGTDVWLSQETKTSNQLELHNIYTLSGLQDKTTYKLRMYAKNKFNQSQYTDIETIQTPEKANSTALGGVIGGVAGGLVAVIAILILIAFVLFKRKAGSGFPNKKSRSHSDSAVEGSETEELKVNILYQSAGPDFVNQGPNTEYAEVSKPHKKPNKAEVQKHNDVYAEVDKKAQQKNVKKKNQKDKKKPPKSGKTKGGALNNNADGEYANSGIPMGNMSDGAYSNAESQSAVNKKNDQGLEYADLTFGSQITKGKQPVIHGDENRTIYSDVDHTKKAPPPPQESEYEETDIRHGKK